MKASILVLILFGQFTFAHTEMPNRFFLDASNVYCPDPEVIDSIYDVYRNALVYEWELGGHEVEASWLYGNVKYVKDKNKKYLLQKQSAFGELEVRTAFRIDYNSTTGFRRPTNDIVVRFSSNRYRSGVRFEHMDGYPLAEITIPASRNCSFTE